VAPDIALIRALWADRTSERSMGITWLASVWEYDSAVRSSGTVTWVIRFPLIATFTARTPYPYWTAVPVALALDGEVVVGAGAVVVEWPDGLVVDGLGDLEGGADEPDVPFPEPPAEPAEPADPADPADPGLLGRGASTPLVGWVWKAKIPARPARVAPSTTGARLTTSLRRPPGAGPSPGSTGEGVQ
jgi:hypothetical protein